MKYSITSTLTGLVFILLLITTFAYHQNDKVVPATTISQGNNNPELKELSAEACDFINQLKSVDSQPLDAISAASPAN